MASRKQNANTYTPKTKVRRRRKRRPFNHKKKLGKRSPFFSMNRTTKRGQG